MNETIIYAILNRLLLQVTYNDVVRVIEPHSYGYDKSAALKVRAYQRAELPEHEGWRMFKEDAITEIALLQTPFNGPRPGFQPNDRGMETIIAELDGEVASTTYPPGGILQ